MECSLTRKIGGSEVTFKFIFDKHMAFFKNASFLYDFPEACPCGSNELRVLYRTPEGYEYAEVECLQCKQVFAFGQHKEGGTMFGKGWKPPYEEKKDEGRDRKEMARGVNAQ